VAAAEVAMGVGAVPGRSRRAKWVLEPPAKWVLESAGGAQHDRASWARAAVEASSGKFSDTAEGALAVDLLGTARANNTNNNYDSKVRQLLEFCGSRAPPLDATALRETDFVEYVVWQAGPDASAWTRRTFSRTSAATAR
jgi:hypothetical protein